MHFPTAALLTLLTSIATATSDIRRPNRNAVRINSRQTSLGLSAFQLIASVQPGQDVAITEQIDGLYINPYHIGAAMNDVVFTSTPSQEPTFLNGTSLQFNFTTSTSGYNIPYSLTLPIEVEYSAWQPTRANVGFGDSFGGFYINGTGLQYTTDVAFNTTTASDNEFGGWMACNWWHGLPQLFWRSSFYDIPATANCADIDLKVEFIAL